MKKVTIVRGLSSKHCTCVTGLADKSEEVYNNLPSYLLDENLMKHYENITIEKI